jgi:UDP-N-acetylmuramoyl-L-alanyl-D-glutamate--2,6-diaminopimelate ligase
MKLRDLAGVLHMGGDASGDLEISGLGSDSRAIAAGDLFFALAGSKADGAAYAADAARRGAVAIGAGRDAASGTLSVPVIPVDDPRLALALSAACFFHAQPATMVAVTGTSGKTSVASFTRQIWEHDGKAAASIGTTGVTAPGREEYGSLRTTDPVAMHRLLKYLAVACVTHAAL